MVNVLALFRYLFMVMANLFQFCWNIFQWNVEKAAPSHFIFVNEPKTWSEAQSYCRERHTDLASVRNQAENGDIKSIITSEAWIGLYRDPWKWSDGSPTSFTKWHTNKPTGNVHSPCVLLHKGKWEDRRCDDTLYFFCQLGELWAINLRFVTLFSYCFKSVLQRHFTCNAWKTNF